MYCEESTCICSSWICLILIYILSQTPLLLSYFFPSLHPLSISYSHFYFIPLPFPSTLSKTCHITTASHLHSSKPDSRKVTSIGDKEHHQQADPSMSIMRVAEMASDRNWDLEIRSSIRTRQLMTHQELKEGWHWDGQEVLAANVGEIR